MVRNLFREPMKKEINQLGDITGFSVRSPNLKDSIKKEHLHNVVYEIECPDCDKKYIGETGRRIEERFKEHAGSLDKITARTF